VTSREWIPYSLIWLRLGLTVVFPPIFFLGGPGWLAVAALAVGLVSDIFDGVLARRWGTVTPMLRRYDSNVDTIFYGTAGASAVAMNAAWLAPWRAGLFAMFALMIAQNVINGIKYGQQPAYHMWSGKSWSIVLVVALVSLFLAAPLAWAVDGVVVLGIFNSLEGIVATLVLPRPMTDVPTVFHAFRLARG
jgi:CDP-diacylglycerol--glycerol-3-phosphate 3-phosphatidyltransferase